MYNGTWIIDSSGKGRRVKETLRAEPERRLWNPFRKRDVLIQFVFEGDPVLLPVAEVKALLFAGFTRHSGITGSILAKLRTRLEPAQTLCEVFRILSAEQEAVRRTL